MRRLAALAVLALLLLALVVLGERAAVQVPQVPQGTPAPPALAPGAYVPHVAYNWPARRPTPTRMGTRAALTETPAGYPGYGGMPTPTRIVP